MSKRNKILFFLSVAFIFIGLIIILVSCHDIPILNDYNSVSISDYTNNKKLLIGKNKSNSKNSLSDKISNNTKVGKSLYKAMKKYNEELVAKQYTTLTSENILTYSFIDLTKYGIINDCAGYIEIPKINLELPIYLGASDENMAKGVAHLNGTSAPIGGKNTNCVICGHTGYVGRTFFDNLSALNKGDEIYIHNYWNKLTYKVVEMKTVLKNESSILYIQQSRDIITLFTCISDGRGDFNRYVVIAEMT